MYVLSRYVYTGSDVYIPNELRENEMDIFNVMLLMSTLYTVHIATSGDRFGHDIGVERDGRKKEEDEEEGGLS